MGSIQTLWGSKVHKIIQKLEDFIAKLYLISNIDFVNIET